MKGGLPPGVDAMICHPISCGMEGLFSQLLVLLLSEGPWLDPSPGIIFLSRGVASSKLMLLLQGWLLSSGCLMQRTKDLCSYLDWRQICGASSESVFLIALALSQLHTSSTSIFLCCHQSLTIFCWVHSSKFQLANLYLRICFSESNLWHFFLH